MEGAPAGRFGELFVFALGVDDDDVGAEHERAQYLQLRRVALAGAGLREDDGIVIFKRKAVEENERRIVAVDAVENAAVAREVEGDEREDGRQRRGVQFRMDEKLVGAEREARAESLLLLEDCRLRVDELRVKDAADVPLGLLYLLFRVAVERDIETDVE